MSICSDYVAGNRLTVDIGPHDECHRVTCAFIALPPDEYRLCSMYNSCLLHQRVLCAVAVNSRHTMLCSRVGARQTRSGSPVLFMILKSTPVLLKRWGPDRQDQQAL